MDVTKEAYRTADESGSPDAAGTVAWNWISELAQAERDADAMLTEIVSQPVEGGGRVTRLYRGSTLLAVATTFRDTMNCTVLTRWVSPALTTAQSEAAELRKEVERLREALKPFARHVDKSTCKITMVWQDGEYKSTYTDTLTPQHFSDARAALKETQHEG